MSIEKKGELILISFEDYTIYVSRSTIRSVPSSLTKCNPGRITGTLLRSRLTGKTAEN